MKSWKKPTPEQIARAIALLGRAEQYRYFFDRLENPEWIPPLKAKGFFQNPPQVIVNEVENTVRFPPWSESRYLARMAAIAPNAVHDIVLEIPFTENVRVHEDLVDAVLALPPQLASEHVPKVIEWIKSPYNFPAPDKLSTLVVHLVKGQRIDSGFELTQALFDVLPDPQAAEKKETDSAYLPPLQLRTYFFDAWLYEKALEAVVPMLASADGKRTLSLLFTLLDKAIHLSQIHSREKGSNDGSPFWRPSIEGKGELNWYRIKDALVTAVRNVAESLARNNLIPVEGLVQQLESQRWLIFHRLGLHVLRLFPNDSTDLIEARLINVEQLETSGLRREYALLLQERFKYLSSEKQTEILELIEAGPDLAEFVTAYERWRDEPPTEGQITQYANEWRRDRLALIVEDLPVSSKNQYNALVKELGPAKSFISAQIGPAEVSWVGGDSPKTAEELKSLGFDEIFSFLRTWNPPDEFMGATRTGLGQEFSNVVASNPGMFVTAAKRFPALHPAYVNGFFSGLRTALKQEKEFEWLPVLTLCNWVVTQPVDINRDPDVEYELRWNRVRQTIAELLSEGMQSRTKGEVPFDLRTTVWEILKVITDDPEPTPAYEARYGGTNMDPATLSINTIRGQAMHTVMRYALWVKRHSAAVGEEREIQQWLGIMPEVQEVLKHHLEPVNDPSLAVRAVYGQWFPWLVTLDFQWTRQNTSRIFPVDGSLQAYRDAAWNAYITFNRPYDDVFDILREEYRRAIEQITSISHEKIILAPWPSDVNKRLIQHLMVFYWRGRLELDEPNGLLVYFYSKVPDELRASAFRFVGQSLHHTKEEILPDILERLKALWVWRLNEARNSVNREPYAAEMSAFGWWFTSNKFDDIWAMTRLKQALELSGKVEDDHSVVKRLAELASTMPLLTIECFDLIVDNDKDLLGIYRWPDYARTIISSTIQSSNESAKQIARELAEKLGRRGYSALFRDLIS